jgi:hypothetical protein
VDMVKAPVENRPWTRYQQSRTSIMTRMPASVMSKWPKTGSTRRRPTRRVASLGLAEALGHGNASTAGSLGKESTGVD